MYSLHNASTSSPAGSAAGEERGAGQVRPKGDSQQEKSKRRERRGRGK
jgi:hypothetical protein